MLKSEFIIQLANKNHISNTNAELVINLVFHTILDSLITKGRVEIKNFGTFTVRKYKAYEGRNPKTGKNILVKAKKLPHWKTSQELKQRIDGF